jgi:predicted phage tail protein
MLRKIKLYGALAKFVGHRVLEADVATAAEAVRFLLANWPELERHMADQHYRVHTAGEDLTLDDIHNPMGREIQIVPVVVGAGAAGRILLGIGLIAASFLLPGAGIFGATSIFGVTAAAGTALGVAAGTILSSIGASLVLGGIAELLSPTPSLAKDDNDPRKSFSFSGIQNTSRPGLPVPVVYGEMLIGSVVVSAGIDIVQVSA